MCCAVVIAACSSNDPQHSTVAWALRGDVHGSAPLYMQAVEGLLAISDYQRRRVFNRVRPTARQMTRLQTRRRRDGAMSPSSETLSPARAAVSVLNLILNAQCKKQLQPMANWTPSGRQLDSVAAPYVPVQRRASYLHALWRVCRPSGRASMMGAVSKGAALLYWDRGMSAEIGVG